MSDQTVGERECMTCGGFLVWVDVDDCYRCYGCGKTVYRKPPTVRRARGER